MADGAGMAGAPLDVSGRKPGAAGGIHAVDSDAAVVVDAVHAAQGVRVVDSSGLNHILPVEAGQTLAQTIWLSGELSPPALCSGLGRCGACRVRFLEGTPEPCDADSAILGADAVRGGWRLACRHTAVVGMAVELPPPPSGKRKRMDIRPDAGPFRLAVDLGYLQVVVNNFFIFLCYLSNATTLISYHVCHCLSTTFFILFRKYRAEKEGFEPSRRSTRPIPLAGAPLRPLEYFSRYFLYKITSLRDALFILLKTVLFVNLFFNFYSISDANFLIDVSYRLFPS